MGDVGWVPSGRKTRVQKRQPRVCPSFLGLFLTSTAEVAEVAVAGEDVAPPVEVEAA